MDRVGPAAAAVFVFFGLAQSASAQTFSQRGFVDGSLVLFPQDAANDSTNLVGDLLVREEVVVKPSSWIQFAAGADFRANSHDQVDDDSVPDLGDRGTLRARVSVRRLLATVTGGPVTINAGKQFIRWGKADIVNPTDRFAPRDFLNVVDAEFIGVTGVRGVVQIGAETFEAVWLPRFTPSRLPLVDQRWTALPPDAPALPLVDGGARYPVSAQTGVRWGHVGDRLEYSLSFYEGFNHLPTIGAAVTPVTAGSPPTVVVTRRYPHIRSYGADAAMPTRWLTVKAEAAYFTSPESSAGDSPDIAATGDEYVLYVVQAERQTGEWVIVGGYAGEVVTARRSTFQFAPDRGLTRAIVARASYTVDVARSFAFETAVRENGGGTYLRAEYSQARGQHWRATLSAVGISGRSDDFLGQYRRNSHLKVALRYSF